jgi:putative transposase
MRAVSWPYNEHRPHRALGLVPPDRSTPVPPATLPLRVHRRDLLGGLINEYEAAA